MMLSLLYSLPGFVCLAGAFYLMFSKALSSVQLRRAMAVLLFLLGVSVICYSQYYNPSLHDSWGVDMVYCVVAPFCAPCYFLFLNRLTTVSNNRKYNLLVFLPSVIFVLFCLFSYLFSTKADLTAYISNLVQGENTLYEPTMAFRLLEILCYKVFNVLLPLQAVSVVLYGELALKRYFGLLDDYYSTREDKNTFQIRGIHTFTILVTVISLMLSLVPHYENKGNLWIVIPFVAAEIYLVIQLIRYVHNLTYTAENLRELIDASQPGEEDTVRSADYSRNLPVRLKKVMETDKLYLDPTLSLISLSARLGTNRTYVSQAIKTTYGCSFSDYVNRYRIDYAVSLMKSRPKNEIFIQNIATECGCGSVQTFYRYFRQFIGETPVKWLENCAG